MAKTPSDIFEHWKETIATKAEDAKSIGAVYQFKVTGDNGGDWILDLTKPEVRTGVEDDAQCIVTIADEDFVGLVEGETDGMMLFTQGKLMVEGDMNLALQLQTVLDTAG